MRQEAVSDVQIADVCANVDSLAVEVKSGEPLSQLEDSQLVHRQHLNFRVFEHSFYQYQKGLLDSDQWRRHELIAQSNLSRNIYAQRMWQRFKKGFSADFVAVIDK